MNKKLQTEIREFIGNDPAQAVERVRANRIMSWNFFDTLFGVGLGLQNVETCFNERYGLTVYGSALSDVIYCVIPSYDSLSMKVCKTVGLAATADAETRIAAMLWAAAWVIVPELEDGSGTMDLPVTSDAQAIRVAELLNRDDRDEREGKE